MEFLKFQKKLKKFISDFLKASPGNIQDFEEIVFGESSGDSNCLACVKISIKNNLNVRNFSLLNLEVYCSLSNKYIHGKN
jgi:translation elongation factor EF-Ts